MKKSVIFFTTFILFLLEALFHYCIGKADDGERGYIHWPNCKEWVQIVGVLLVFSVANSYFADVLDKSI
jgi:preprotein translocase subunit SecE